MVAPKVSSAAWHCPTELAFLDADDLTNIVHFAAPSASTPGKVNTVGLDVLTGETHCTCRAAECGRRCWHVALAQAAWDGHAARILAAKFSDQQLQASGKKAAHMCAWARHRRYRVLPADQVALLAARCEYRRRNPAAAALAEAA